MPGAEEFNLSQPALDRRRKRCNLHRPLMRLKLWSLPVASALLGGLVFPACRALPPSERITGAPLDAPATWQASKEGRSGVDTQWVSRFKDSRLQQMVDEALANNRDLRAAAARLDQARQQARIAGAAALPTADLNFGGNRQKQNFIGFPIGGPGGEPGGVASNTFNQFNLNVAVNWEADIWGRIRAGKAAATADAEAAEQDIRAAQTSLAAQIASTWFTLCEAREQVALASEAESIFQKTADAVRDRFARGQQDDGGAGAQLRLAETDVATAQAARVERQQALDSATRQLEILLGRYPAAQIKSASLPAVPAKPPVGLPSELLQRRPDVLAAERRFAASGKRLTEARRALFPRLALTSSAGTATGDLTDLLKSDFGVWQLAGNLVQPILTGGRLRAEANVRYAREQEALAALQQTVLQAFGEVETALMAEKLLAQRETALTGALTFARQADEAARADFAAGVSDLLNVLTAQNRAVQLRSQLLTLRRLRLENRVNLHLALGGDFATKPSPSAKPAAP
jgi:multidrug efflux system outer membrane protein